MIRATQTDINGNLNITHFRDFLTQNIPDIYQFSIAVRPLYPPFVFLPFSTFPNEKGKRGWWDGYNNIKHSDMDNYIDGNLKNVIYAVGGIAILSFHMRIITSTSLFVNIGKSYPEDVIDIHPETILFYEPEE